MSQTELNKAEALKWIDDMKDSTIATLEDFTADKERRYHYICKRCKKDFRATNLLSLLNHTCYDPDRKD